MKFGLGKKILIASGIVAVIALSFATGLYVNFERVTAADTVLNAQTKPDLSIFYKVWNIMDQRHVSVGTDTQVTTQQKIDSAIKGLIGALGDPYSEYLPKEEKEQLEEELSGTIDGAIGATIGIREEKLIIIAPLKDSPAEKAGVKAGDIIYEIDGKEAGSLSVTDAVKKIRGKTGTQVILTLLRKDKKEPIKVTITRAIVNIPTLETQILDGNVYLIKLYEFNAQSVTLFKKAINEFYQSKSKKLILDLRNNPGGYLGSAVDIASQFIPAGKVIVSEDFGKERRKAEHRSKGFNVFGPDRKMVVLINAGSASASEILAGALADYGIATLVGEKSFGKGSVQELIPLDDTGEIALKLTIAYWATPKGTLIQKNGLVPNFIVKFTEENLKKGDDPQLKKALEVLKAK